MTSFPNEKWYSQTPSPRALGVIPARPPRFSVAGVGFPGVRAFVSVADVFSSGVGAVFQVTGAVRPVVGAFVLVAGVFSRVWQRCFQSRGWVL